MAFVGILSQIKLLFTLPVIQLVWYILKQLFTSVSVKVVDIYSYPGVDPGEVKWVNFHSPFSEPPSFFFFLIPQILK